MSSSKEEPIISSALEGVYTAGDYVVPSYSNDGKQLTPAEIKGSVHKISSITQAISNHANRTGATALATAPNAKVKGKAKKKIQEESAPLTKALENAARQQFTQQPYFDVDPDLPAIDVVFITAFGRITLTTVAVLEEDNALCLIFKNDKELRFTPNTGSELDIIIGSKEFRVFYPGVLFRWTDKIKRLMVLIKKEANEE
jgi:hypothetical protein